MQTLRKKTSPLKYRNEPARFFGDGVVFKAKLIGILEVGEARGDRMCQEALQDLKIAIRAAGEHKQRITIHVTIEGLRLRDEKTGESLYHHPVHKISFIAQDMTDSRAFGYIFGSPDCGHRFFGIKTDKAASQVVLAMRDLFQCVFELKKKEIELAKQHIQNRITAHEHQQIKSSILEQKKTTSLLSEARSKPEKSPEATATANLVDLEQELSSIQRGITQMQRITPSEDQPPLSSSLTKSMLDDPFGDSFSANFSSTPFNILPPPSSSKRQPKISGGDDDSDLSSIIRKSATPPIPSQTQSSSPFPSTTQTTAATTTQSNLDSWFGNTSEAGFTNNHSYSQKSFDDSNNLNNDTKSELIGAFTDLDPLALGTTKPYVDKKYFFQDLKNPPKKALKDLSEHESIFDAHFSPQKSRQQINHSSVVTAGSNHDSSFATKTKIEKVIDPFDEEDFSKINIDQLEAATTNLNTTAAAAKPPISPNQKSIILPDTKISLPSEKPSKSDDTKFSYSDLPSSDTWTSSDHYRRQTSSDNAPPKNVFSVASKKLPKPNLFGQRNVKRDSNGINMRRLQESDSLSENEPELPPRLPDSSSHEPPPLPPKNQPTEYGRYSSRTQSSSGSRYDYTNKFKSYSSDSPPSIPLPSRKINRTESNVSSSSTRSMKKSMEDEEDYLSPNPVQSDGFPQLPPPPLQKKDPSKTRGPRKSETDPKNLDAPTPKSERYREHASIIPDITLSQLLTLGIDDLAQKLNVPAAKLNTMTLVELTTYLNDFIEKSNRHGQVAETPNDSPVFKVSFDESSDAVFEAKFDDNFGNEMSNSFVANFDSFNQTPISVIPTADRYAVFREIIDKDIQKQQTQTLFEGHHQESIESNNSNSMEEVHDAFDFSREFGNQFGGSPSLDSQFKQSPLTVNQSSNKIAESLSGIKDRYQALRELRNIVLVEDLFDKSALPPPLASISDSNLSDEINDDNSSINQQVFETAEAADNNSLDNIPTYSISWADAEEPEAEGIINSENIDQIIINEDEFEQQEGGEDKAAIASNNNKDDLEINEYMNKAISELSLDQRLSPNIQIKTPTCDEAPINQPEQMQKLSTPKLNDMSTSPIPTIKSPSLIDASSPPKELKEPIKHQVNLIDKELTVDTGSEQLNASADESREKTLTPSGSAKPLAEQLDSWANFEQETEKLKDSEPQTAKQDQESGSSVDGKLEWKQREKEYHKRWPKHHTSSSSRDVSPWEEGNHPPMADQKKRMPHVHPPPHYDRYARPPIGNPNRRRRNSCDEDLEDDYEKRPPMPSRMRASKGSIHRSKEILEADNPNWYGDERDRWYPDDEDDEQQRMDRHRSHFDRNAYERSTYGPPFMVDKREPKSFPYDRRGFDKRSKYYRYNRPEYDYDPYEAPPPARINKARKDYDDYEPGTFERGSRESRSAREYFYDRERDRRSFDSNESYDSGNRMHRMGSGDIYHDNYRDRYVAKMQRRGQRSRMDDDSDEEVPARRPSGETGSLQRGQAQRTKLGNIKLDDEVWGASGKWKQRPSSAAADRMSGSAGNLSDSDGEKEKRHRRKSRQSRSKEVELRSNYATIRHPPPPPPPVVQPRRDYYDFENDPNDCYEEPRSPSNASPRGSDGYYRKRPTANVRTSTTPKIENKSFTEYVKPGYEDFEDRMPVPKPQQHFKKSTSRDLYLEEPERKPVNAKFEQQPQTQPQNSGKFNFDGFESDFNASSPKQAQQQQQQPQQQPQQSQEPQKFPYEGDSRTSPNPSVTKNTNNQQKLRFNENVAVSKFDKNSTSQQMFEDDFIESWTPEITSQGATSSMQSSLKKTPMSNLKFSKENIKKSDSVNIFARKNDEDPFANDDFFNSEGGNEEDKNEPDDPFDQWSSKNNFANFDDNKNI